jgi:hypothetical protein
MPLLDDPAHWRARADEMRLLADNADPGTEALLEVVAQPMMSWPIAPKSASAQSPTRPSPSAQTLRRQICFFSASILANYS